MVDRWADDSLTRRLRGPFAVSWPRQLVNKDVITILFNQQCFVIGDAPINDEDSRIQTSQRTTREDTAATNRAEMEGFPEQIVEVDLEGLS